MNNTTLEKQAFSAAPENKQLDLEVMSPLELNKLIRRFHTRSNGNVVIQGRDVDILKRALLQLAQLSGAVHDR
jgi:hypothetical protein